MPPKTIMTEGQVKVAAEERRKRLGRGYEGPDGIRAPKLKRGSRLSLTGLLRTAIEARDAHKVSLKVAPFKGYVATCSCGLEGDPGDNSQQALNSLRAKHDG